MAQERTQKHNFTIPPVGHRTLKSAVSILLCYAVYLLRGHQGLVFYSMLAALWCIRPYFANTVEMAVQRVSGTLIGAVNHSNFRIVEKNESLHCE